MAEVSKFSSTFCLAFKYEQIMERYESKIRNGRQKSRWRQIHVFSLENCLERYLAKNPRWRQNPKWRPKTKK
jgi:hypothetical protein